MVTLTATASDKLKGLIAEEGESGDGLRVKVVPGGCSGFEYQLTFVAGSGEGFVINNPNSTSSCGCGKSFQA